MWWIFLGVAYVLYKISRGNLGRSGEWVLNKLIALALAPVTKTLKTVERLIRLIEHPPFYVRYPFRFMLFVVNRAFGTHYGQHPHHKPPAGPGAGGYYPAYEPAGPSAPPLEQHHAGTVVY
jgi:hypothetical protein